MPPFKATASPDKKAAGLSAISFLDSVLFPAPAFPRRITFMTGYLYGFYAGQISAKTISDVRRCIGALEVKAKAAFHCTIQLPQALARPVDQTRSPCHPCLELSPCNVWHCFNSKCLVRTRHCAVRSSSATAIKRMTKFASSENTIQTGINSAASVQITLDAVGS